MNDDLTTCDDEDECLTNNGDCVQRCVNEVGSFSCNCHEGFIFNVDGVTCDDIDECATNNGGCEQGCQNNGGGYECLCEGGLRVLGRACVRTNECLLGTDLCHEQASCHDTQGGYTCECRTGYEGDGFNCTDLDECEDPLLNDCVGLAQCLNIEGGYTCVCPEDLAPFEGGCIVASYCEQPTRWDVAGAELAEYVNLLPQVPTETLDIAWGDEQVFREDWLKSDAFYDPLLLDLDSCDLPDVWDATRLEAGPLLLSYPVPDHFDYAGGESYCRVDVIHQGSSDLDFTQRFPTANWAAVSGEPSWLKMRFPLPPGHQARSLTYTVEGATLRGSHPDRCHPDDIDSESQQCEVPQLAEGQTWNDQVPAGVFILWGAPHRCQNWLVTGPHPPNDYSWGSMHTVEVPEELQDVDELVATLVVYRQHYGCQLSGGLCYSMTKHRTSLSFAHAFIKTEGSFNLEGIEPPQEHPRLFGTDEVWLEGLDQFVELDCSHGIAPKGGIPDLKNTWSQFALGYKACRDEPLTSINEHPDVQRFLEGSQQISYKNDSALRVLHLLRRERACHRLRDEGCQFELTEVERIADAFIVHELERFDQWTWTQWSFGFDIRSAPPFLFWNLFLDILGDRLSEEQMIMIRKPLSDGIESYLKLYADRHWAIFNGNNWTTSLSFSAIIWAITHWYEDERAQNVAEIAIKTLATHAPYHLSDGVYQEGVSYAGHAFSDLYLTNRLVKSAFGIPIGTIDWSIFKKQGDWLLKSMLSDGATVDFSDAWKMGGWRNYNVLYMLALGNDGAETEVDPCDARRFFTNVYYGAGMQFLWLLDPLIARDWEAIVAQCPLTPTTTTSSHVEIWPVGGYGLLRSEQPGRTEIAELPPIAGSLSRYQQADQTQLAVSAIPNRYQHTELDFGSLIWAAYGHRLLTDMGYGSLGKRYLTEPDYAPDNNPTGHNTLVIAEANHPTVDSHTTNTSQLNGLDGLISLREENGLQWIELDGSAVYGANPPQIGGYKPYYLDDEQPPGWLKFFQRHLLPIAGGHYVVVDLFKLRDDREPSTVQEYWHIRQNASPPDPENCDLGNAQDHVNVYLNGLNEVQLNAVCSVLDKGRLAESVGRINGISLHPGAFSDGGDVIFVNRINQIDQFKRLKWSSDVPQSEGIRVFVLSAATAIEELPLVELSLTPCNERYCAEVNVGVNEYHIEFEEQGEGWEITPSQLQ